MKLIRRTILVGALLCPAISAFAQAQSNESDTISKVNELNEVVVKGFGAKRNLNAPEMGRVTISETMITNLPVLFGEPDIVKTLQTQPGVSQGIEGFTGLFVRGGDNDQNLFLYQGLPLYHVSHLGGIFSSFNVATVSRVDFYKAAFPSKYGGRISSITDVMMKQPDFEEFHGRFNVGLLSANAYVSGPIVKDKTAFSVGLRRSWLDIVSIPTLAIVNAIEKKKGKKHIAGYNFTDFNARLDHIFSNSMSAYVVGYYGYDNLKIGLREFEGENNSYIVGPDGKPALADDWAVPMGPDVNAFEKELGTVIGADNVIALESSTSAIHIALILCDVKPGDEIIVQSFTFCASTKPIAYLGATPLFVDFEKESWNMDPDLLEEAIKDRIAKTGKKPKL